MERELEYEGGLWLVLDSGYLQSSGHDLGSEKKHSQTRQNKQTTHKMLYHCLPSSEVFKKKQLRLVLLCQCLIWLKGKL